MAKRPKDSNPPFRRYSEREMRKEFSQWLKRQNIERAAIRNVQELHGAALTSRIERRRDLRKAISRSDDRANRGRRKGSSW